MRRLAYLAAFLAAAILPPAAAQLFFPPSTIPGATTCAGAGYQGPGNIVSGATVWIGLRAYNAAVCGNNAIQLTRVTDSATHNIATLNTGKLDVATASSFAGTDATCTATASGTTLSVSSCSSGTLHAVDQITGSGFTGVVLIQSIGTCGSPPGTCTLNASQTVSSPVTITASAGILITGWYDQTGGATCTGSPCYTSAATSNSSYVLAFNCDGTLPCGYALTKNVGNPVTASYTWPSQPNTLYVVGERTASFTTFQYLFGIIAASNQALGFNNTSNTITYQCGSSNTTTANDSVLHFFMLTCNGASGSINVDGTLTTQNLGAANMGTNVLALGAANGGNLHLSGQVDEFGVWPSAISSGNQSSMHSNVSAYWGTP